ncbi:hypothetical protein FKX85_16425 [Echinicola soli]|uniref:Uncharacterized protein n=1 Tax=Echinicola soli TaxID=2591634 RepID=A0A514CL68_9BACT|nr:DUF6686 family protein [Echinicola soli]QDH80540.1 hypothetical protein FKX85_16425 [Echinicola soli]
MNYCNPEVILMKNNFILTRCEHCGRIGLMYGQCMLSFSKVDFTGFCRYIDDLSFEGDHSPFYDGVDRIVIETYHMDIQFTLMEEEFYRLKSCLSDAQVQFQIEDLLKK